MIRGMRVTHGPQPPPESSPTRPGDVAPEAVPAMRGTRLLAPVEWLGQVLGLALAALLHPVGRAVLWVFFFLQRQWERIRPPRGDQAGSPHDQHAGAAATTDVASDTPKADGSEQVAGARTQLAARPFGFSWRVGAMYVLVVLCLALLTVMRRVDSALQQMGVGGKPGRQCAELLGLVQPRRGVPGGGCGPEGGGRHPRRLAGLPHQRRQRSRLPQPLPGGPLARGARPVLPVPLHGPARRRPGQLEPAQRPDGVPGPAGSAAPPADPRAVRRRWRPGGAVRRRPRGGLADPGGAGCWKAADPAGRAGHGRAADVAAQGAADRWRPCGRGVRGAVAGCGDRCLRSGVPLRPWGAVRGRWARAAADGRHRRGPGGGRDSRLGRLAGGLGRDHLLCAGADCRRRRPSPQRPGTRVSPP